METNTQTSEERSRFLQMVEQIETDVSDYIVTEDGIYLTRSGQAMLQTAGSQDREKKE